MKTIFDAISVFEGWLDYLEKANGKDLGDMTPSGKRRNAGYANYTLYAKWYKDYTGENYQAQPYCATGLSDVFVEAYGLETAKKLLGGALFYNVEDFYQRMKRQHSDRLHKTPKVGDVVLFFNGSRHHHTALCVKLIDGGFVTIEANTSSGNNVVVPNGGATTRKSYNLNKVRVDFFRPPYAACGIAETKTEHQSYAIGTGKVGLLVTASSLNVRTAPDIDAAIVSVVLQNMRVYPDKKAFDSRGVRWFHVPAASGWVSGEYLTGWILEEGNGRWWYLLDGGGWHTNKLKEIDGAVYAFDQAGYMIEESITVMPDENGALKL